MKDKTKVELKNLNGTILLSQKHYSCKTALNIMKQQQSRNRKGKKRGLPNNLKSTNCRCVLLESAAIPGKRI